MPSKLFGLGFPNISICTNGFYGIHEYIRKHQYTDYILNHDKENCEGIELDWMVK